MEVNDGSKDEELQKSGDDKGNQRDGTQKEKVEFNWELPLYAAIGFGVGFRITCGISNTSYNIARNAFAALNPNTQSGLEEGIITGIIVGIIGGGALGLAFRDKRQAFYFALTGAVGFAIAFAVVLSLEPNTMSGLGRDMISIMGGPERLSLFEVGLANGLGQGVILGAIGGLVLGLASTKGRFVSSLLLCIAGAIWFANAFAIHHAGSRGLCYSWDAWAGAVGGAVFGLTLALFYKISDILPANA